MRPRIFRRARAWCWARVPDPHGFVGFALVMGVLFSHLLIVPAAGTRLFSENLLLEAVFHAWLMLGPPVGVLLGIRRLLLHGRSLIPLLSVALGAFLTLVTAAGLGASLVLS